MSNLLASLGHNRKIRVVLGHTLNIQTLTKIDEQKKKVLSKFMILCWVLIIAILGHMWPADHRFNTPGSVEDDKHIILVLNKHLLVDMGQRPCIRF